MEPMEVLSVRLLLSELPQQRRITDADARITRSEPSKTMPKRQFWQEALVPLSQNVITATETCISHTLSVYSVKLPATQTAKGKHRLLCSNFTLQNMVIGGEFFVCACLRTLASSALLLFNFCTGIVRMERNVGFPNVMAIVRIEPTFLMIMWLS